MFGIYGEMSRSFMLIVFLFELLCVSFVLHAEEIWQFFEIEKEANL